MERLALGVLIVIGAVIAWASHNRSVQFVAIGGMVLVLVIDYVLSRTVFREALEGLRRERRARRSAGS